MQVQFDHEKMEQIDTIKKAIRRDFKARGYDYPPESVTDRLALEYALTFTSEVITLENNEKRIGAKILKFPIS